LRRGVERSGATEVEMEKDLEMNLATHRIEHNGPSFENEVSVFWSDSVNPRFLSNARQEMASGI
jgi:hypothetical protein